MLLLFLCYLFNMQNLAKILLALTEGVGSAKDVAEVNTKLVLN